jgi:2-iminobutanoate/2-iminopropanoate deaminase
MDFVASDKAPKAIGPYSQAVRANGLLFTSGQVGLVPATGELAEGGFEGQVRQTFQNLTAVLTEAGSGFDRVLKATVFITDFANFQTLNTVYSEFFGDHKPARTTVAVAGLPKNALVEIDLVALA